LYLSYQEVRDCAGVNAVSLVPVSAVSGQQQPPFYQQQQPQLPPLRTQLVGRAWEGLVNMGLAVKTVTTGWWVLSSFPPPEDLQSSHVPPPSAVPPPGSAPSALDVSIVCAVCVGVYVWECVCMYPCVIMSVCTQASDTHPAAS
jgi:hypothetical protein